MRGAGLDKRTVSSPTLTRAVCLAASLALVPLATGCEERGHVREWRPADHSQPPGVSSAPAPTAREPVSPEEARLRAGAALFRVHCASCHGDGGRGDGPGRTPVAPPTDLTDPAFQAARADGELMLAVAQGRGAMPSFGGRLGEAGIAAVVAYVRTLRATPAPSPAAPTADAAPAADAADAGSPAAPRTAPHAP